MSKAIEVVDKKIEELQKKLEQAKALKSKKEALARSRLKKTEDRMKVLVGAMILQEMRANSDVHASVLARLDKFLVRPAERKLFNLNIEESKTDEA